MVYFCLVNRDLFSRDVTECEKWEVFYLLLALLLIIFIAHKSMLSTWKNHLSNLMDFVVVQQPGIF